MKRILMLVLAFILISILVTGSDYLDSLTKPRADTLYCSKSSGCGAGGNGTFNQTYTDTLYYPFSNPYGFFNITTLPPNNYTLPLYLSNYTEGNTTITCFNVTLDNYLVAHYLLNDNLASTDVLDNIGGYDATSTDNTDTMSIAGKINNAFEFNGADEWVTLPNMGSAIADGDFSVAMWAWKNDWADGHYSFYLTYEAAAGYATYFHERDTDQRYVAFTVYNGITNNQAQIAVADLVSGWHHFTGTYNASTGNGRFYVDGVMYDSFNGHTGSDWTGNGNRYLATNNVNAWLNGYMDDVRIYNASLTDAEVLTLFNGGTGTEDEFLNTTEVCVNTTTTNLLYFGDTCIQSDCYIGINTSFDRNYTDGLYYPLNNQYGFVNSSNFSNWVNASGMIIDWNKSGDIKNCNSSGLIINWSVLSNTLYYPWNNPWNYKNITYGNYTPGSSTTICVNATNSYFNLTDTMLISFHPFDGDYKDEALGTTSSPVNSPSFVAGKKNQSVTLNGVNQYVHINKTRFPTGNMNRTVTAWINTNVGGYNSAILKYGACSNYNGWSFDLIYNLLRVCIYAECIGYSKTVIQNNTWTFVAAVYRGDNKTVDYYLNGVHDGGAKFTNTPNTGTTDAVVGGTDLGGVNWGGSSYWNGEIDELKLYNRTLSLSEIQNLYVFGNYHNYSTSNEVCSTTYAESVWVLTNTTFNVTTINTESLNVNKNVHIDGNLSVKRPYAMFSDNTTQYILAAGAAQAVNFSTVEDSFLINITGKQNISFLLTGDYLIELSAIIDTDLPNNHFDMWVQKNGVNVPRSNTRIQIPSASTETVLAVPFILDMNTDDYFRVMMRGDDTGIKLLWTNNDSIVPETPSIIMTISKISEVTD